MLYRYIRILALVYGCFTTLGNANELGVEFSGFASLAVSYSDGSDIGFRSNYLNERDTGWSIKRDSTLGGQANITLTENWDSVVQVVLQDYDNTDFDNYLELAFLRYRPTRNWAIRAGRLNSDLYLLSEYPYVGYAYLWVRPPHEYYSFASTAAHYDGIDVEYSQDVNDGYLRIKLATGQTSPKLGAGDEEFSVTFKDLFTLSATFVKDEWTIRASTSIANISEFESAPFSYLVSGLNSIPASLWSQAAAFSHGLDSQYHDVTYTALGLIYDNYDWLIQAELGTVNTDWLLAPSNITGYISAGYRIEDMTYFAGVSIAENKKEAPQVNTPELLEYLPLEIRIATERLVAGTQYALQRAVVHQHSVNIGAKWYYSDKLVFKAQVDHFMIQPIGGGLWDIDSQADIESKHNINLFSLSASMVF